MTRRMRRTTRIELTLVLPNGGRLEPIDIGLIEAVRNCRSLSGAGRLLDISYRKTWRMVDALNRTFASPVVETFPERREGGAEVTMFGERLVAIFRSMERSTSAATAAALGQIVASIDRSVVPETEAEAHTA